MKYLHLTTILLLVIAFTPPCSAQRNKNNNRNTKPTAQEETPQQRLFSSMLHSTAKVMVIDSVVVAKSEFLKEIPLNKEAGTIASYADVFGTTALVLTSVYSNEYGDRRIFANGDTTAVHLYSSDLLGITWSEPRELSELEDGLRDANFPFLMSDGITLFFSAKGNGSLGGYDIFMTLFDSETGQYYKPENFGLPYNSTANDYMVAFSETDSLGWLVSDRYQPQDSVCIYTFVPKFPRQSFSEGELTDKQLRSVARLERISDTWAFGDYDRARMRYLSMLRSQSNKEEGENLNFFINDNTVYNQEGDFKTAEGLRLFHQLCELKTAFSTDNERLDVMRVAYHDAGSVVRNQMISELRRLEKIVEQEQRDIKNLEKQIRLTENKH